MDIIRYIRRRWLTMKQDDGFAGLEPWAAKEIANGGFPPICPVCPMLTRAAQNWSW